MKGIFSKLNGWDSMEDALPAYGKRVEILILHDPAIEMKDIENIIENCFYVGKRICTSAKGEMFFLEGLLKKECVDDLNFLSCVPVGRSFFRSINIPDMEYIEKLVRHNLESQKEEGK